MLDLREESVVLEMQAGNKDGVLKELATALHGQCPQVELETLFVLLRERENIGSTGVGNGVAIPHARVDDLDQIHLGFGRSKAGIGFEAIDNQPVHLVVMLLSPANKPGGYLKTLGAISRSLKKTAIRSRLKAAESRREIVKIFQDLV